MMLYSEEERLSSLIADRRALHQIPEVGLELPETAAYVWKALEALNPDRLVRCAQGVKAVFCAKNAKQSAIALRADMDALRVVEQTGRDFCSRHEGVMHACGHDTHMASMLTVAKVVAGRREALERDVVFLFQPGEESMGGAKYMVEDGALTDPKVGVIYGMHVMPTLPTGTVGSCVGPMMSSMDVMRIDIEGRSIHGATPHLGCDATMAMAQLLVDSQAALARCVSPFAPKLLSFGRAASGTMPNVVSDHAELGGTVRAYDEDIRQKTLDIVYRSMASVDALYGTHSEMRVSSSYPPVINDAAAVDRLAACAGERYRAIEPVSISEDFAFYLKEVPGAFFFCGCGDENHTAALHSDRFDLDETALLTAVTVFEKLVFGEEQA